MYEGLNTIHYIKWNNKGRLDGVRKEKKTPKRDQTKKQNLSNKIQNKTLR